MDLATHCQPSHAARFEVASIKRSVAGSHPHVDISPGRLNLTAMRLRDCILLAYHIQPFLLFGGVSWMDSDRFDISAVLDTGEPAATPQTQRQQSLEALQVLLKDRFQLFVHRETRIVPIYALAIAKGGFKIQRGAALPQGTSGGYSASTGHRLVRENASMSDLADALSARLGRHVDDGTGLQGLYSFVLEWTTETPSAGMLASPDDDFPTLAAAIRTQLGLTLQPGKGPVEVLVIERAQRPSEN